MMTDKANIESGLKRRRNKPASQQLASEHSASAPQARRERSDLNLFDAFMVLESKQFRHFADCVCELVDATAPYFIHIVRANRTRNMTGRCPGVCQTGHQEKQTVAG